MSFVLFALLLLPSPAGDAAQADSVLVVYDLRPVLPRYDSGSGWESLVVPPFEGTEHGGGGHDLDFEQESPDVVVDLLSQILGDELRFEGREIALDGTKLVVLAPAPIQARVRDTLEALEAALGASVELQVDLYELPAGAAWPARAVMDAAEVDRGAAALFGPDPQRASYTLSLSAGRTAVLDMTRREPFLFDYDVEIAQGSVMYDPIVRDAQEGTRMLVRAVPSTEGLSLSIVALRSKIAEAPTEIPVPLVGRVSAEKEDMREVQGPAAMQSVAVLSHALAFDGFLPEGKALLFGSRVAVGGHEGGWLAVLRKTGGTLSSYQVRKLPNSSRSLVFVNSELVVPPAIELERGIVNEHTLPMPYVAARTGERASLFLFDWMKYRFSVWRRIGPWAIAVHDPAWDDGAPDELSRLLAQWKPESRSLAIQGALLRGEAAAPVRWMLPARPGTSFAVASGLTTLALHDFDVEVAQFAGVADPVRVPIFEGLTAIVATGLEADAPLALDLRATALVRSGGTSMDLKTPMLGTLQLPAFERLELEATRRLAHGPGKATRVELGDVSQKEAGGEMRLSIEIR
jgi:hypothetical protein